MGLKVLLALINGSAIQGWASIFLSIWFVGGAIMVSIGMVGLYVGKTYIETKHRPRYHIMDEI